MKIRESVEIDRTTDDVFAFVADYSNDVRWRTGVSEMTPTPPGIARPQTKVHEVLRFAGSTHVTDTVVTEVEPGRSLRFEGGGSGGRVRGRRSVEPSPQGGTRFVNELEVDTTGLMRALEPVLARLFRRGVRRDLAKLQQLLEAPAGATVSAR